METLPGDLPGVNETGLEPTPPENGSEKPPPQPVNNDGQSMATGKGKGHGHGNKRPISTVAPSMEEVPTPQQPHSQPQVQAQPPQEPAPLPANPPAKPPAQKAVEDEFSTRSLPPEVLSDRAIDSRLRRVFKPRADGTYLLDERWNQCWADVKGERNSVKALFEKVAYNVDRFYENQCLVSICIKIKGSLQELDMSA